MLEENKHHLLKVIGVIIATFLGAFLAFYLAVDLTLNRMFNPEYQIRKMEKTMNNNDLFLPPQPNQSSIDKRKSMNSMNE